MRVFYGTPGGLVTFPSPLLSVDLGLGCCCGSASSSAAWRCLAGTQGHLLPRVLEQGVPPMHSMGTGLGMKTSSSHRW